MFFIAKTRIIRRIWFAVSKVAQLSDRGLSAVNISHANNDPKDEVTSPLLRWWIFLHCLKYNQKQGPISMIYRYAENHYFVLGTTAADHD